MGMSIDDNIDFLNEAKKIFEDIANNPNINESIKTYFIIESLENAIDTMREYQKIFDKYEMLCDSFVGLDGETISKKVDEFCIDTMRGLLGEHYAERIGYGTNEKTSD